MFRKYIRFISFATSIFGSLLIIGQAQATVNQLDALTSEVVEVPFLAPQLSFASWLEQGKRTDTVSLTSIRNWRSRLAEITPNEGCEALQYQSLALRLNLLANRTKLFNQLPKNTKYSGVMSDLPRGKQWYLHWLNSWLLLESEGTVTEQGILQLQAIANDELEKIHPRYQALQAKLPKVAMKDYSPSDHGEIVDEFREREQIVKNNLQNVFGDLPVIPEVKIAASGLPASFPASFPAPGIYNNLSQTFYYHFPTASNKKLMGKSLDWLYLHEATPGHHMQFVVSQTEAYCSGDGISPVPLVSAEGWGAYVETLGKELGLYQHPSSQLYVYEWRILRALRVLIDIGIHYENWSDQQALKLWGQYLPDQMAIAQRELKRIKRWPVQVITYVYGKHHIQQLFNQLKRKNHSESDAAIRNLLLRLSNQAPVSYQAASYFLKGSHNR